MTLRLLGPDQSTVLWDFTAPTGSGNPNTVICNVGAALDFGTVDPSLLLQPDQYGATLLEQNHPPVEVVIPVIASASTDDNLWAGLGQLNRYCVEASRDHPLFLEWTELSSTYYFDIIGAAQLIQIVRGTPVGGVAAVRKATMGPVPLVLLRQPWRRGAAVTSSSDTVEDDPATGTPDGSRVYALTVTGDLPTPFKVRAQMDTGAAVSRLTIGHRWRGSRPSTYFSEYLSDTGWFQCEATNRNWTVTLGSDTTATTDGALASPATGNVVAQVKDGGATATTWTRRVRATRTTAMDSLRGSWIPSLRMRTTANCEWEVQLRWSPSTADPVVHAEDVFVLNTSGTGASAHGYVEPFMGRIDIPQTVALSGMAVEIWARRISGSGDLNLDLVDFWPAEGLAQILVPGSQGTKTNGADLTSPPDQITADPVWTAGTVTGTRIVLNTALDACGLGPNTGTVYQAGRHRFTFDFAAGPSAPVTAEYRVTNVTDNTEMAGGFVTTTGRGLRLLDFTADGSDAYQAQVTLTTPTAGSTITVYSITHAFIPTVLVNESVRTDPGPRYTVDKLDTSGNYVGPLTIEGDVPIIGRPGDNHIKLRADEVPLPGYTEHENKLDRDLTVTVTYDPRYAV